MSKFVYGKPIQKICMPKCMGRITWSKHAHAQSQFWELETKCLSESLILPSSGRLKPTCDTRIIHFYYMLEQLFSMDEKEAPPKKRSLRKRNLKANRASETEEQRKGLEKDRARRITKKLQEERKGRQKQKTTSNSAWPLSKD